MADSIAEAMKQAQAAKAAGEDRDFDETRLDAAWKASAQAPDDDAAAARFMDVLLAEPLFCPIWEDEDGEEPEDLAPKMVEINGADTMLLFDSEERLAAYVDEPTAFVALPGRAFFQLVAGQDVQFAINLDVAPSSTILGVEAVRALAELAVAGEAEIEHEGAVQIAPPVGAPEQMIGVLANRIAAAGALVADAWLVAMAAEDEAVSRFAVGLSPAEGASEEALAALGGELAQLGGSFLDGGVLDVAVLTADSGLLALMRRHGLRLAEGA